MSTPRPLSELRFAAILEYSTIRDSDNETSRKSRNVAFSLKAGRPKYVERFGHYALEALSVDEQLADFLGPEIVFVPVPRSAPRHDTHAHWPGLSLANELVRRGLGRVVVPELMRTRPVQKSSTIRSGHERPSPEDHIGSMKVLGQLDQGLFRTTVVLVDDVVTRGAQLLGAASLLLHHYPNLQILGFAACRAMSQIEVEHIVRPTVGLITYESGSNRPRRTP